MVCGKCVCVCVTQPVDPTNAKQLSLNRKGNNLPSLRVQSTQDVHGGRLAVADKSSMNQGNLVYTTINTNTPGVWTAAEVYIL